MHQGLSLSRFWLGLVLAAFCLPLFVGLGLADLETDEAIYSFAVDRILETGEWLEPKSSPSETAVFLEKPPLKFWLVAAPIKAGLLPHSEFGLRFLDAVFGSASFLYVFAIGSLLAGPVCGVVAALLLFIHIPLIHAHGLRTNNMEGALVLSYCAGVFHFLRWTMLDEPQPRRRHVYALALFFVLGFMTKFVAALFLPFTLGLALVGSSRSRMRLMTDLGTWVRASLLVVGLCAPWFVYAHIRFGALLWQTILGEHVVRRLTNYLDPTHLQPWHYYLTTMWREFQKDQVSWLVAAGLVVLLVQTIRRRWLAGAVVLLWAAVPMAIISAGTSKVYHYAYPFLPPIALSAGYAVALVFLLAPAPLRRLLAAVEDQLARWWPALARIGNRPGAGRVAGIVIVSAAGLALAAVLLGHVRLQVDGRTLLRSSGVWRPLAVIVLAALATGTSVRIPRIVVAILLLNVMPLAAYRGQIDRLSDGKHPIRDAAACLGEVQRRTGRNVGLFVDIPEGIWHPIYYNFRRVQPWTLGGGPLDPAIERHLSDAAAARPLLLSDAVWREWLRAHRGDAGGSAPAPPMIGFLNTVLLLPGDYASCSPEARLQLPK